MAARGLGVSDAGAQRLQLLRDVAQVLSSDRPVSELWPSCWESIAKLLDAQRVVVTLREGAGERVVFDSDAPHRTEPVALDDGDFAAGVLARGETIAHSDDGRVTVGVPIRFGNGLLGALVLDRVAADLTLIPLVESCALYLGARMHSESALEATRRYAKLALVDALTGVANRRRFDEALEAEWERARRDGTPLALVMMDVDYFKSFNDRYGHQAGDLCLQQVARALAECAQHPSDVFARYGGEEFVALLPATDIGGAVALAERLRAGLARLNIAHGASSLGRVSISAGVAALRPREGAAASELIAKADAALYEAKIAGRNRVVRHDDATVARVSQRAAGGTRTNLPLPLTQLVGRSAECAAIRSLLDEHRLVSVVGPGGIGKTRVTLHVAHAAASAFPDGVWLVDLGAIADPALVTQAIAAAFDDLALATSTDLDALVRNLSSKRALLMIDNCEHLLAESARVVAAIARGCPSIHVIATSREPLGIVGESRYRLPLLAVPPAGVRLCVADALEYDSVALFVERARAVRGAFAIDNANATTVGTIVRRLDGIALAIELAAARVDGGTLETLAARLDQRFRLLTGGDRGALPRQRTMRATLDWSFDLLAEPERSLFVRLATFAGSFTIDAVAATCSGGGVLAADVGDLVMSLVHKSLVVEDPSYASRYTLLESVRAYAREKLLAAPDAAVYARRHAAHYADLADETGRSYVTTPTRAWLEAAERERPNYRAALEWALGARNDVVLGARLAAAVAPSLGDRQADEGVRWLLDAAAALEPGEHPSIEAHIWLRLASTARALPANRIRAAAERAVELYRALDERGNLAHALRTLAQALCWFFPRERAAADALAQEAIEVARSSGDALSLAYALRTRALTTDESGIERKRELMEESLALFRRFGNDQQIGAALTWISEMEFAAGEEVRAIGYGRAALRYSEASGSRSRLETAAANLAIYAASAGDWPTAIAAGTKALRSAVETRSAAGITWSVQALASVAAGLGDAPGAARLLAFCDARCGTVHAPRQADQGEEVAARRLRVHLATVLAPDQLSDALEAGARLAEDDAIAQALALESRG